ncbi:hypothetical protein [Ketobacter alkanivorans]|uniref:Uncharacterized protein n=1 Tax=Ketobacter alkanivorans TaxID=1917421 RepID=A0A2K9LU35_9GAMM|nr:hypothetical protein [Ketobacter alkanivorans]AUM14324.1 hypothetical protein Kalk_18670 [Ketobacter alkanivorans]
MTEDVIETEESTLDWIWGALQGDFNENPTIGQIITNAAITAIPLVDQVADGRDLVANLKALIWDKRYNEMAVWLGLFFTLIGLIPSLGSLLKGVLKLVYRGAKLDEIFKVFNALAKGNAWEWLKKLRAGELRQHADEAARMLKQVFDNIIDTLKEALSYVPSWAGDLYKNISDLIAELRIIRDQIDEMFSKITVDLEAKLDDLLKQQADNSVEGSSRQTLMKQQEADFSASSPRHLPSLPQSMDEVMKRMDDATQKVQKARASGTPLPQSPYTLDDKLEIVEAGLQEKYIVRVIKTDYAKDTGNIGWVNPDTSRSNYWTTTYTQLEYADKDAELIAKAVGTTYDPKADYTLLVIDAEAAAKQGDITTIIPTYDRIGGMAKSEMTDVDPHLIDQVMTPEYSDRYAELFDKARAKKVDLSEADELKRFSKSQGLSPDDTELLKARQVINDKYGANEQFLGIGITKDVNSPDGLGIVETYSLDKKPGLLGDLEQAGVLTRVGLTSY